MSKKQSKTAFLCSACGNDFPKWYGQCPACQEWGTLGEFTVAASPGTRQTRSTGGKPIQSLSDTKVSRRLATGIAEADRVLGGGLLPGSVILLGGNPGIGKSTLALQLLGNLVEPGLYVSAEESMDQVALRARRLGLSDKPLSISDENNIYTVMETARKHRAKIVVIDSIQTVFSEQSDSLPGSIAQIRECAQAALQLAKQDGVVVIIIGHVTKEGVIAGPRMLEHMVDTVLYLEGDQKYDYRILRAVKNRFGATHEVGVFTMAGDGLHEVENPSELFLAERSQGIAGTTIYPSLEGTRPIMIEVQALVSPANFGTPQRNVNGMDYRRLAMLLAVLEKRMNLPMGTRDVFINLVGGLRVDDPAMDLAVFTAIASSALDKPVHDNCILLGEVGLAGEVRSVHHLEQRLQEAEALGFEQAILPAAARQKAGRFALKQHYIRYVRDLLPLALE
ncbi:MAG: DNA repair protein RadA [Fidelibacterota bacterium]